MNKWVPTFEQWIVEAEDKVQRLTDRIKKKTEAVAKYNEKAKAKMDSAKKNDEMATTYKERAANAKMQLSQEINLNKSNQAKMKSQIKSAETKITMMKQKLAQEEINTLNLEKTKAETLKSQMAK